MFMRESRPISPGWRDDDDDDDDEMGGLQENEQSNTNNGDGAFPPTLESLSYNYTCRP